jgi:hypothetical protein
MQREKERSGLKSVLRMTPNDNREFERPPLMRRGRYWEAMLELFEGSAAAGAELLSIESVGGKELHDEALVSGNLAATKDDSTRVRRRGARRHRRPFARGLRMRRGRSGQGLRL